MFLLRGRNPGSGNQVQALRIQPEKAFAGSGKDTVPSLPCNRPASGDAGGFYFDCRRNHPVLLWHSSRFDLYRMANQQQAMSQLHVDPQMSLRLFPDSFLAARGYPPIHTSVQLPMKEINGTGATILKRFPETIFGVTVLWGNCSRQGDPARSQLRKSSLFYSVISLAGSGGS